MIYITSDQHYGHDNVIKFCKRPFKNSQEMNEALIANTNLTVGQDDELWMLGDFGMLGWSEVVKIMNRIVCKNVHYIFGNHDKAMYTDQVRKLFKTMQHYKQLVVDGDTYALCHFPILDWVQAHRGATMLHGHCHHKLQYPEMLKNKRILDVGVDGVGYNYSPISFEWIKYQMKNKENIVYNND